MKKIVLVALGLLALTACKQKSENAQDLALIQQRDSLNRIIAQKDGEINDMMSTMNDVVDGFRAINEAEERVTLARMEEGSSSSERIRENMRFIQQTMQQNRELINKLRNQLRRTIENLTRQMEEKDAQVKELQAELQAKDIQINELHEEVTTLNNNVTALKEESTQKTQTITSQDKQLNTAWFVFGTKKELREQHIYDDGKVLQANFNREYFTKIDIRVDKEIRLYSRSAKLLTSHPASAYTLTQDANKQYILRITNPQLFWSASKYLVVLVK